MYAAKGSRADLAKPTNVVATRVVSWTPQCAQFLEDILSYIKGTYVKRLRFDARGAKRDVREWRPDVSVDADYKAGRVQTGIMMTLTPVRSTGPEDTFLPIDFSSTGQRYTKLSAPEAETVGAVHGMRVAIRYQDSWWLICYPDTYPGEEQRGLIDPVVPDSIVIRQREDNSACIITLTRGWSQKLCHVATVYGVSMLWAAERVKEGRVIFYYEKSQEMLADPLTKLTDATVLERRGILVTGL